MFIVPTAVEVAREQAFLAEKDIFNGDKTEVLNEFNLVQMSNVCSFGKPKRNAGHDKERKKKKKKGRKSCGPKKITHLNCSPSYWQRSQRWSNTIFRLPLRSNA
jgi:hypothetical protein